MAAELNRRGVQTARGGQWTARSVIIAGAIGQLRPNANYRSSNVPIWNISTGSGNAHEKKDGLLFPPPRPMPAVANSP
jgi:hypothetical protein